MKKCITLLALSLSVAIESKGGGLAKPVEKYPTARVFIGELPKVSREYEKDFALPVFTAPSLTIETPLNSGRWRMTRDKKVMEEEHEAYENYEHISMTITAFGLESQTEVSLPTPKRRDRRTGVGSSSAGFEVNFSNLTEPVLCTVTLRSTTYMTNETHHFVIKPLPWNWGKKSATRSKR